MSRTANTADQVSGMCFRTGTGFHCRDTTVKMLWGLSVCSKALIKHCEERNKNPQKFNSPTQESLVEAELK